MTLKFAWDFTTKSRKVWYSKKAFASLLIMKELQPAYLLKQENTIMERNASLNSIRMKNTWYTYWVTDIYC